MNLKEAIIIIEDWDNKKWEIDFENSVIRGKLLLEKGEKIKIIGKMSENNIFIANQIGPWERTEKGKR